MMQKAGPILRIAFVLAVVCLVASILLGATYGLTWERIAEAERARLAAAFAQIFPQAELQAMNGHYEVFENGEIIGYAATAQGRGFGGRIDIIVGINVDGTIRGVRIITHAETPGLGDRITEEEFLRQFEGKHLEEVKLTRDRGSIDAITGATISAEAVTTAVGDKARELMELLTKEMPQ
jgi:electron transport complex protein RnfG